MCFLYLSYFFLFVAYIFLGDIIKIDCLDTWYTILAFHIILKFMLAKSKQDNNIL
jgi:hypothetical protein